MYNFKFTNKETEQFLNDNCFTKQQKEIIKILSIADNRKKAYEIIKKEYNISTATFSRELKRIHDKIENIKNNNSPYNYKIYIHTFPNSKQYVGVCQCCADRWCNGNGYADNEIMYKDIKKYGWNNIKHEVVFETVDANLATKIETLLIKQLKTIENGYNRIE